MINELIEMLKTYTDGKDNTGKVEISVMQLNRIIKALEQQPTDAVDRVTIKEYLESFGKDTNVTVKDAVSRQGVAEVLLKYAHSTEGKAFAEFLVSQINDLPSVIPQQKPGYISIDDAMSAFDDFMCNDIEPEGQEVFLELLKDRAERAKNDLDRNCM